MKPLLLVLALLLAAPASLAQGEVSVTNDTAANASADIISTLDDAGSFSILVSALRDTGLADALASGETYTLFAPTDEAFQQLPAGTLDALSADELADLLRYHLVVGAVSSSEAAALPSTPTVRGDDLTLAATGDALTVNGVVVTEADIAASNGVIHVIGNVLTPAPTEPSMEEDRMEEDKMDHDGMDGESAATDAADAAAHDHEHASDPTPIETDDQR